MDHHDGHQEIYLEPNPDGESYAIVASDVQIHTCRVYERARDSSKVRSRPLIDYRWETKLYDGRLVAVHKDGSYLAYVLHNQKSCSVRVINRKTKMRALIKNFVGQAVDLVWSFASYPLLLAVSDEGGNVQVYAVEENGVGPEITLKKYLRVERSPSVVPRQPSHRLAWCPYVPDQPNIGDESSRATSSPSSDDQLSGVGASDEQARLLAVFHGTKVDVLNIDKIVKDYGCDTTFASIDCGISSKEIDSDISAVAISPDATALALSSQGGEVKFYILDSSRDVSHAQTWKPHKGRPVTSIVFLDNFLAAGQNEDTFWKYLLTSCDGNRELKLWNCENWECMATLRIDPPEAQNSEHTPLSLTADWTSTYIFLTDIERKSLYTVEIVVPSDGRVRFSSFTEFPLLHPALSLAIVSAGPKRFRPTSPGATSELEDGGENEFINMVGVQVFLYAVNPKSLLELDIRFVPPGRDDVNESLLSSVSTCKLEAIHDTLSDLSIDLLRAAPPASDVAKTAGTNFASFNIGGRRGSASVHSGSPNDRTPTHELEVDRHVSASPSSQEVSKILAHPLAGEVVGEDDSSCLLDVNNVVDLHERPPTPTAQSLLSMTTSACASVTLPTWNQSNTIVQHANSAIVPDYTALTDALTLLCGESNRVNTNFARQQNDLDQLKDIANSHQTMWESVYQLIQEQTRQGLEKTQKLQLLQQSLEALKPEQFRQNLTRTVEEVVQNGLDATLKSEILNVVVPCVAESLKPLKDNLQADVAQKLTATDALVRENIGKMMKSKQFVEAIGQVAGQAAANVAMVEGNKAYRESFQNIIAPSFESTARSLFTQMNDAFQRGTKEYLDQLQRQSAVVQNNTDEWKKGISSQLLAFAEQLKTTSERQLSLMQANMEKHFETWTHRMQETLYADVRSVVKEEVAKAVADGQQALNDTVMRALRSQAPTPVPSIVQHQDRQLTLHEINQYLNAKQFNTAFQHALQAKDIACVNHVCQRVDPTQLFSESTCPLQQPVLVALLQQLAADLVTTTELKLKYMQEAIPFVDCSQLGGEMKNTIRKVHEKLSAFLQSTPGPYVRTGNVVLMLLKSLMT